MSLISGLYYRGDPKQKPKQWGPSNNVSMALLDNSEKFGISRDDVALAMPLWSPGDQYDYSRAIFGTNINDTPFTSNSLLFNGSSQYITNSVLQIPPPLTILSKIDRHTTKYSYEGIFVSGQLSSPYGGFGLWSMADGRFRTSAESSYLNDVKTTNSYPDVCSHSIASRVTDTQYAIYIDGKKASSDKTINTVYTTTNLNICNIGKSIGASELFDGAIHYMLVFTIALSESQIAEIHDNPYQFWQPPTFRAYFDFGSTASSISCNLLAAAAQATRIIQ